MEGRKRLGPGPGPGPGLGLTEVTITKDTLTVILFYAYILSNAETYLRLMYVFKC